MKSIYRRRPEKSTAKKMQYIKIMECSDVKSVKGHCSKSSILDIVRQIMNASQLVIDVWEIYGCCRNGDGGKTHQRRKDFLLRERL